LDTFLALISLMMSPLSVCTTDTFFNGQMGQESIDLRFGHFGRMPDMVKKDKAFDPLAIGLFGPGCNGVSAWLPGVDRGASVSDESEYHQHVEDPSFPPWEWSG
jgi:hypothetical protein